MFEDYLKSILSPLLSNPEELRIAQTTDQMGILLSVEVAKQDMGATIGKGGETINSIRHLLRSFGGQHQQRVSVKVMEPLPLNAKPHELN